MARDLDSIGVPPRLRKADRCRIPSIICDNLSLFPDESFGFVGPGGSGKSCALVASTKEVLLRLYEKAGPATYGGTSVGTQGAMEGSVLRMPVLDLEFMWIGWPAAATRMKNLASQRKWDEPESSVHPLCQWLKADPARHVLVVDDIGMERIGDHTSEQLELLIDTAYNHECRFFWTSEYPTASKDGNEKTLRKLYSYRLVSRLTGLAPPIRLPEDMPDLRVKS
jgi:DNA replication protein DnaC